MPDPRLDLALAAAARCSALTLPLFRRGLSHELKSDGSPVTAADRDCEHLIRTLVTRDYPDDAICGEEFGQAPGATGYRWYLDPIDGTKSFIAGVPLWGTLIGIELDGAVVAGIAALPALNELVYASRGEGAWHITGWQTPDESHARAQVSRTAALDHALFCYTSAASFARRGSESAFTNLLRATRTARGWGDCYGWLLVATGRADIMIDTHVNAWDVAPFAVILPEAGGQFSDWRNQPNIAGGDGVGSNGILHEQTLAMLR
jgi:histidinol-phosphatase